MYLHTWEDVKKLVGPSRRRERMARRRSTPVHPVPTLSSSARLPSRVQSGVSSQVQSGVSSQVQSGVSSQVQSGVSSRIQSGVSSQVQSRVSSRIQSDVSSGLPPLLCQPCCQYPASHLDFKKGLIEEGFDNIPTKFGGHKMAILIAMVRLSIENLRENCKTDSLQDRFDRLRIKRREFMNKCPKKNAIFPFMSRLKHVYGRWVNCHPDLLDAMYCVVTGGTIGSNPSFQLRKDDVLRKCQGDNHTWCLSKIDALTSSTNGSGDHGANQNYFGNGYGAHSNWSKLAKDGFIYNGQQKVYLLPKGFVLGCLFHHRYHEMDKYLDESEDVNFPLADENHHHITCRCQSYEWLRSQTISFHPREDTDCGSMTQQRERTTIQPFAPFFMEMTNGQALEWMSRKEMRQWYKTIWDLKLSNVSNLKVPDLRKRIADSLKANDLFDKPFPKPAFKTIRLAAVKPIHLAAFKTVHLAVHLAAIKPIHLAAIKPIHLAAIKTVQTTIQPPRTAHRTENS
eukprot:g299.t1